MQRTSTLIVLYRHLYELFGSMTFHTNFWLTKCNLGSWTIYWLVDRKIKMAWILQGKQGREGSWCAWEPWGGEALRHAWPKKLCAWKDPWDHACYQQVLHWTEVKHVDWLLMVLLLGIVPFSGNSMCCAAHKLEDISYSYKAPHECLVMTCYM